MENVPQNIAEVDSLLASIESPTEEIQESAPDAPAAKEEATTQAELEYELSRKGSKQRFPLSKILSLANQGFDYNEKMREYNTNHQLFQSERQKHQDQLNKAKELEARIQNYRDIEEYRKTNPQWWDHVNETWRTRTNEQGQTAPQSHPMIEKLSEQVNSMNEYITSQKERETVLNKAKEDTDLDSAILDFKEQNNQLDWVTLDKQGQDLERQILKFAIDNKLTQPNQYAIAAKAYLHEELVKRAELKSKEQVGKDIQKVTKLGLGAVKEVPTQKITKTKDVRSKTWDDIGAEALSELGIG